jgi:hypothetical protein
MTAVVMRDARPIASLAVRRIQRQARSTAIVRMKRRFNIIA